MPKNLLNHWSNLVNTAHFCKETKHFWFQTPSFTRLRHSIMRHLESPFCHTKEVLNVKLPFTYVMYIEINIHFHLGTIQELHLFIGNLMIMRVTRVDWTQLGLEWPPAYYVVLYTGDIVSPVVSCVLSCILVVSKSIFYSFQFKPTILQTSLAPISLLHPCGECSIS